MSLYLLINIFTISIPFLLSFDKRVHFYTHWKFLFPAMIITMAFFTIWDIIFTSYGVWGFNERYHAHLTFFKLPLEEYLFFITVPYASVFTLYVIEHYFPGFRLKDFQMRLVSYILIAFLVITAIVFIHRTYTAVNFIFAALLIVMVLVYRPGLLNQFYLSYLIILVPFGIVNGILTGSFIEDQVVWYNNSENLGIRLGTVPFEDVFYGMSLILLNYFLMETFRKMSIRTKQRSS